MHYKRIGIDIDDVVRDFMESVHRVYLDIYPQHAKAILPINGWSLSEVFPIGDDIYDFIFNRYAYRIFYEDARIYPDAGKGLDILAENGYDLIAITMQRSNCAKYTEMFFDYYELPFSEKHILTLDDSGIPGGKSNIPVDIMIDDNMDTLLEFHNKGIEVVCMSKPWNKSYHKELIKLEIPIVTTFMEFVNYIKKRESEYAK